VAESSAGVPHQPPVRLNLVDQDNGEAEVAASEVLAGLKRGKRLKRLTRSIMSPQVLQMIANSCCGDAIVQHLIPLIILSNASRRLQVPTAPGLNQMIVEARHVQEESFGNNLLQRRWHRQRGNPQLSKPCTEAHKQALAIGLAPLGTGTLAAPSHALPFACTPKMLARGLLSTPHPSNP
jgi:hypothetical protein